MIRTRYRILLTSVLLVTSACGSPLGEGPVQVELRYQGDSDAGPQDATGTASIDTTTGKVDIEVQGLIIDTSKDQLEGWLAGGGESPLSTSHFSPDASGAGSSSITLGDLSERTFSKVVITIQPKPDPDKSPDPRHSIQGEIPDISE